MMIPFSLEVIRINFELVHKAIIVHMTKAFVKAFCLFNVGWILGIINVVAIVILPLAEILPSF